MGWQDLQDAEPELARFGAARLGGGGPSFLATVGEDGAPRVHPVTPILAPGRLFVFMEPTSPKGRDLERGSGYALHGPVEDHAGGSGEFRVRGHGRRVTDPDVRAEAVAHATYDPADRYVLFELSLDDAFATEYVDGEPIRRHWTRPSEATGDRADLTRG